MSFALGFQLFVILKKNHYLWRKNYGKKKTWNVSEGEKKTVWNFFVFLCVDKEKPKKSFCVHHFQIIMSNRKLSDLFWVSCRKLKQLRQQGNKINPFPTMNNFDGMSFSVSVGFVLFLELLINLELISIFMKLLKWKVSSLNLMWLRHLSAAAKFIQSI